MFHFVSPLSSPSSCTPPCTQSLNELNRRRQDLGESGLDNSLLNSFDVVQDKLINNWVLNWLAAEKAQENILQFLEEYMSFLESLLAKLPVLAQIQADASFKESIQALKALQTKAVNLEEALVGKDAFSRHLELMCESLLEKTNPISKNMSIALSLPIAVGGIICFFAVNTSLLVTLACLLASFITYSVVFWGMPSVFGVIVALQELCIRKNCYTKIHDLCCKLTELLQAAEKVDDSLDASHLSAVQVFAGKIEKLYPNSNTAKSRHDINNFS